MTQRFLANKIFSYEEVVEILTSHLNDLPDIKAFCQEHKLNYNTVLLVKTSDKKYPKLVTKLLEIFGYTTERIVAYKFR